MAIQQVDVVPGAEAPLGAAPRPRWRLVLLSFLMLFVELALIRWTGSNVVYLSYFSNFVLLGSFLGIGIGFLRGGTGRDWFAWAPVALAWLVGFALVFDVQIDRSGDELIYFGEYTTSGLPTWVTLPILFLFVAVVLAMITTGVAREFKHFAPLEAYRLDIAGSLLGIIAFTVLSFLHAPPLAWGVIASVVFLVLLGRTARVVTVGSLVLLCAMLGIETFRDSTSWSPYYKITTASAGEGEDRIVGVSVNGIPHQNIRSMESRLALEPIYAEPYRLATSPPRNVLIIGAGNGGDVSVALAEGAEQVDAVEIDPRLYELGKELNPDQPYSDPRVTVHIDDGRAFLERSDERYDMILFALPDSLTLVSGQSSLRLESYLFTQEAVAEAREHLTPDGVFAMYNYYREDWLVDRLGNTLAQTFDATPCIERVAAEGGLALLASGKTPAAVKCAAAWSPQAQPPDPVTDNYPFLYLRDRALPSFYLLTIALILVASVVMTRIAAGPLRRMARYSDLFLMGVAFLLLETKSVVQFALLFGTTWVVNALVFAGILLSVYLAVELARRIRLPRPAVLYGALILALMVAWLVPQSALLELGPTSRFAAAITLAFAPVFIANLVFAQRFADVAASTTAFGANLLGAMVGGLLEYAALVVGYRPLLLLVGALYIGAFLLSRRTGQSLQTA